jgi:hypothetical protein
LLAQVEKDFPRLVTTGYVKTSEETPAYNCVAFTLGDESRVWWPPVHTGTLATRSYWPSGVPIQATVEAFVEMYRRQGFETCVGREAEPGIVRIAIYVEPVEFLVEHVALQLPNGRWISKMGFHEDIAHTLEGLEGAPFYYECKQLLSCPVAATPKLLRTMLRRFGL